MRTNKSRLKFTTDYTVKCSQNGRGRRRRHRRRLCASALAVAAFATRHLFMPSASIWLLFFH